MDSDLENVHLQIMQARMPEDLFGAENVFLPPGLLQGCLDKKFTQLKATTDPAKYQHPEDKEVATELSQQLSQFYEEALNRVRSNLYGLPGHGTQRPSHATKSFTVGPNRYYLGAVTARTDYDTRYVGYLEREELLLGSVAIHLATREEENERVEREIRTLDVLHKKAVPQWKHFPVVLDRFRAGLRTGVVFRNSSGFTLAKVRHHRTHHTGVDQRHMVWMLDRVLSCLGYVHSCGIVHGALSPESILIEPLSHNAIITEWGGAALNPARSKERIEATPTLYTAPEVASSGKIGPWSDIYSVGKVMIWLLGGSPENNELPATVEAPLRDLLLSMVQEEIEKRPSNAWDLYSLENQIKDSLWERKFLHFDMT